MASICKIMSYKALKKTQSSLSYELIPFLYLLESFHVLLLFSELETYRYTMIC